MFHWEKSIKIILLILKSVGMWPKEDFYKRDWYTIYAIFLGLFLVFGFNLSQIINIFYVYQDLEALTGSILLLITNILAIIKIIVYQKHLKSIKNLLKILNLKFQPNPQELVIITPILNRWKKIYIWYSSVVGFNVLMWFVAPMFGGLNQKQLPFAAWFPFDLTKSPNYQLVYLYQMVCMCPITICNLNLDCIIMALMMFIQSVCEILCYKLKNLKGDNFAEDLKQCVKIHKIILRFAQDSNSFFNLIVLGQFATSTAVTAFIMFQLTLVSPVSSEGLAHLAYIHGITTQIFLYCWFGNEVEIKSSNIPLALYESAWITQPNHVKRIILIICLRCQRPIRMTAIKLFNLSLQTFIAIMRSAYSYFALLSTVNK